MRAGLGRSDQRKQPAAEVADAGSVVDWGLRMTLPCGLAGQGEPDDRHERPVEMQPATVRPWLPGGEPAQGQVKHEGRGRLAQ